MARQFDKLAFVASPTPEAKDAAAALGARYAHAPPEEADVVVALGGDGLDAAIAPPLHGHRQADLRHEQGLRRLPDERLQGGQPGRAARGRPAQHRASAARWWRATSTASPTRRGRSTRSRCCARPTRRRSCASRSTTRSGSRSSSPTALLIATPAGSTAYNLSVNGPILPLNAPLLALTPISAFRPRRWRGALLPDRAQIRIDVIEPELRPGQRRRRSHRVPQRHRGRRLDGPRRRPRHAARPRPQPRRAHPARAVRHLKHDPKSGCRFSEKIMLKQRGRAG